MPIDPNVVSQQKKWMKAQDDTQHPNIMKYHKEHKIKSKTAGLYQVPKTADYIIFMVAYLQQASDGEEYSKHRKL